MRATAELPDTDMARRRLTQPLGGVLYLFAMLITAFVVLGLLAVAFGSHDVQILGIGHGPACADVPLGGVTIEGSGPTIPGLHPGATAAAVPTSVCVTRPSASQRILSILTTAPSAVLYLAIVVLVFRLLIVVRLLGPFVVPVASRLRFLAWFVLIGSVLALVGQNIAGALFLASTISQPVPVAGDALSGLTNLWVPLLAACALLTLARIMRTGARMQDDLAGTV
jgi:hypothetical protein